MRHAYAVPAARGIALFVGAFTLVNVAGTSLFGRFDANLWWIDMRGVPALVVAPLLVAAAVLLALFGLRPRMGLGRRRATTTATAVLLGIVVFNVVQFYVVVVSGHVRSALDVPLSLLIAIALTAVFVAVRRIDGPAGSPRIAAATALACALLFPMLQMLFFGSSDYRRPADAIVVFGALTYADGTPSWVLADRVRTACELYRHGLAASVVMSGGPGLGEVHETEAMRDLAVSLGVPREAIALDRQGLNTAATAENLATPAERRRFGRILAVSNAYHLPRIKMAFQQRGIEVFTVPARETYAASIHPFNVARELAAIWVYYLGLST